MPLGLLLLLWIFGPPILYTALEQRGWESHESAMAVVIVGLVVLIAARAMGVL